MPRTAEREQNAPLSSFPSNKFKQGHCQLTRTVYIYHGGKSECIDFGPEGRPDVSGDANLVTQERRLLRPEIP